MYPQFTIEIVESVRLGIKSVCSKEWSFCTESVGNGRDVTIYTEKSQQMFIEKDVSLVLGVFSSFIEEEVYKFYNQNRKSLIHFDLGVNIEATDEVEFVNRFSISLWKSAFLTGKLMSQKFKKTLLVGSFYESGYQTISAFEYGFTSGTEVIPERLFTNMVDSRSDEEIDKILGEGYDSLFFLGDDEETLKFVTKAVQKGITVYTSPHYLDANYLSSLGDVPEGVKCLASWDFDYEKEWIEIFEDKFDKLPSFIGMEAYQLGVCIGECLNTFDGYVSQKKLSKLLKEKLKALRNNSSLNTSGLDVENTSEKYYLKDIPKPDLSESFSGWKNLYLTI